MMRGPWIDWSVIALGVSSTWGQPAEAPKPNPAATRTFQSLNLEDGPRIGAEPSGSRVREGPLRRLFRLGEPDQYVPPPSGWTVIAPPIPPPPIERIEPAAPAPKRPWAARFFDNNFRYLDDPDNTVFNTFDFFKRIRVPNDNVVTDFGGEFRWQSKGLDNARLLGAQNNFNLFRERLYLDTWYRERFRTYLEVIWADSSRQTLPPLAIDINHGDFLNAFGELKLAELENGTLSGSFGARQELLFGNQRLVSPVDWANTRITFDNVGSMLYRGDHWHIDAFYAQPNQIRARQIDTPQQSVHFFGTYWVYKDLPGQVLDLYYLGLVDFSDTVDLPGAFFFEGDSDIQTFGARWQGRRRNWRWEFEGAYQFGIEVDRPRNAGFFTGGLGYVLANLNFRPEFWFYFDYASGSRSPEANDFATFNPLFPLGHKYLGYLDLVGRRNILAPNAVAKIYFGDRANLLFWYHNFHLASARDALYNGANAPIRIDPTGRAGRYVGDELDIILNLIVNPNMDWQFGLSHLWAGPFIQRTARTPAQAEDSNLFYTQFVVRF